MIATRWFLGVAVGAVVLASQMGHGGCGGEEAELFGPPTESTCPTPSTLTYTNFGKPFMERYCTRCHNSELVGDDRMGAPSFHDFDTLFGIKAVSDHIDETTAAGPAVVNRGMPQNGLVPTDDERLQLGEWIACGMPE